MQYGFRLSNAAPPALLGAFVVLTALLSSCVFGQRAEEYARPRAEILEIEVLPSPQVADATRLTGELLAVEETGLLLLAGQTVLFVSYESIRRVKFERIKNIRFPAGQPPPPETVKTLRLVSRFPYGLSPEVKAALLAAYDQTEVEVW
jgi:hypothetical protein